MLLTSASSHAIRAMIYLASQPAQRFCRAREISEREQIPNPFLWKILRQLRAHRLLESVRGAGGGYRLGMPPSKIRLSEIVRAVEGDMEIDKCILNEGRCVEASQCALHLRLQPAWEQFLKAMENTTLEAIPQKPADRHARRRIRHRTTPKA
jgi:Rrf2 family protein